MKNYSLKLKIKLNKNGFLNFKFQLLFFIFSFLILPISSLAYTETTSGGELVAEVYPEIPGSFTNVSIRLISYEVDLIRSNIVWVVNGKKQREGIGKNDLDFTTGEVGKKVVVDVEVSSYDGIIITKQIIIIPAETNILWESDSYVPPFYRGKSLATQGSTLRLVALPNFITESGAKIDPSNLIYKWKFNSRDITSVYGKSSMVVQINNPNIENTFFVEISNLDETLVATKSISLAPMTPKLLFYESNPLLGAIYERSLPDNVQMNEAEAIIGVEPYFFNTNNLSYVWGINNETLAPSKDKSGELTIRQPSNNRGESILSVLANSTYQSAQKSIRIKFGQSIFGF